jgi:TorA maturation chaperone TorD
MSRAELCRTLAAIGAAPGPATARHAELLGLERPPTPAEHTELFTFQLYPYASVHLGPEGKLGGVARDRIAGFLRALEVVPPPEPDHLIVLLDAYAQLIELDEGGARTRARHARTVLLHEHLASWLPRFTHRVAELAPEPYRRWAGLLDDLLTAESDLLGVAPTLPAHLRDAPGLDELVDEGRDAFVDGVLAPVRSGLVLARADLARAARDLDLGLRIGERAYTLAALLEQDADGTLRWLTDEARRQSGPLARHASTDPTARFWQQRLDSTAALLEGLVTGHGVSAAG